MRTSILHLHCIFLETVVQIIYRNLHHEETACYDDSEYVHCFFYVLLLFVFDAIVEHKSQPLAPAVALVPLAYDAIVLSAAAAGSLYSAYLVTQISDNVLRIHSQALPQIAHDLKEIFPTAPPQNPRSPSTNAQSLAESIGHASYKKAYKSQLTKSQEEFLINTINTTIINPAISRTKHISSIPSPQLSAAPCRPPTPSSPIHVNYQANAVHDGLEKILKLCSKHKFIEAEKIIKTAGIEVPVWQALYQECYQAFKNKYCDSYGILKEFEEFRNIKGFLNLDGPFQRILRKVPKGILKNDKIVKGALTELRKAWQEHQIGNKTIEFSHKSAEHSVELDLVTATQVIECKNVYWPAITDLKNVKKQLLKQAAYVGTYLKKEYIVFSVQELTQELKDWLIINGIHFYEG